jgi:hypothetical protein
MANAAADADSTQTDPDGGESDKPPHPQPSTRSTTRHRQPTPADSHLQRPAPIPASSYSTAAIPPPTSQRQGNGIPEARNPPQPLLAPPVAAPSSSRRMSAFGRPAPSQASTETSQKFTLKDLIPGGGLSRRSSNKSASSRRSDSERGADPTTASLAKKYGVCERLAIGKGATSVVRIVHKWDSFEEKLYAVKVHNRRPLLSLRSLTHRVVGVPKAPQERNGERVCQEADGRVLYLVHVASSKHRGDSGLGSRRTASLV